MTSSVLGTDGVQAMNRVNRNTLTKCRQSIVQDLEVNVILDYLIEYGVVDDDMAQKILAEVSYRVKILFPLRS